jgi:hypothetical protein
MDTGSVLPSKVGLEQGFATGEMGLMDQVARQQFRAVHVADGSKADVTLLNFDVRYSPKSGQRPHGIYEYTP